MAKEKHVSATPATDWLKAHKVNFKLHTYDFVPHGGTTQGAKELGIDNHVMIKTLIMARMIFDAGNERSVVRRFVPVAGTASCTFVRQTSVCPTKVLALRGRGIRRCRTL